MIVVSSGAGSALEIPGISAFTSTAQTIASPGAKEARELADLKVQVREQASERAEGHVSSLHCYIVYLRHHADMR